MNDRKPERDPGVEAVVDRFFSGQPDDADWDKLDRRKAPSPSERTTWPKGKQ